MSYSEYTANISQIAEKMFLNPKSKVRILSGSNTWKNYLIPKESKKDTQ